MRNGSGERRRLSRCCTTDYDSHIRRAIPPKPAAPALPLDAGAVGAYISSKAAHRLRGRDPPPDNKYVKTTSSSKEDDNAPTREAIPAS